MKHLQLTDLLNKPIPDRLYFRIRDVAEIMGVEKHVLRFWETQFPIISPQKSDAGHRVYRKTDIESALLVKYLLYVERLTIEGARKRISEMRKEGELKKSREEIIGEQQERLEREQRRQRMKVLANEITKIVGDSKSASALR